MSTDSGPIVAAPGPDGEELRLVALGIPTGLADSVAGGRLAIEQVADAGALSLLAGTIDGVFANSAATVRAAAVASLAPVLGLVAPGDSEAARALLSAGADDVIDTGMEPWLIGPRVALARERWEARARSEQLQRMINAVTTMNALLATRGTRGIQPSLEVIGEASGADQVYVMQDLPGVAPDEWLFQRPWVWSRAGAPAIPSPERPVQYTESGLEWRARLTVHRSISVARGDGSEENELVLRRWGVESMLVLPIHVGGRYWGAIGFNLMSARKTWSEVEITALKAAASALSAVVSWSVVRQQVRNMESTYRELFERATDIVYTTDLGLHVTSANPTAERVLGYSADELARMNILELLSPASRPIAEAMRDRKVDGSVESTTYELTLVAKDGHEIPVEVSTHLTYVNGVPTGTQGIARDISGRKLSEESFRALYYNNPQPIIIQSIATHRFLDVNDAACEHYGWTRDEFQQMTTYDIRPVEDHPRVHQLLASERGPVEDLGQWRHLKKNGEVIDVRIHTREVNFQGERARIVFADDITESLRTEAALRRALEVNEHMMASVCEVILSTNDTGIITFANERAREATGYAPAELIGQHFTILTPDDLKDEIDDHLTTTMDEVTEGHFELPTACKDGTLRWFEWSVAPLWENGVRIGFVSTGRDITPQRESEAEILRLASVVESSADAIITTTPDGTITSWNHAAERLYGAKAKYMIGQQLRGPVMPGQPETFDGFIADALASEEPIRRQLQFQGNDSSISDIDMTMFRILDDQGEVALIGGFSRDVTSERTIQRELSRLGEIVNSSVDAIVGASPEGILTSWNAAAERICGYTAAEAIGQSLTFVVPDSQRDRAREGAVRLLAGETLNGWELEFRRKDGELILVTLTAFPIRDEKGKLTGFGGVIRDITEQRRSEQLLLEQQEVLDLTFRSLRVGVFMAAEDGSIVTMNDEFCTLAGRTREELTGRKYWETMPHDLRERLADLHVLRFSLPKDAPGYAREWPLLRPDGTLRIISTTSSRFDRPNGDRFLVVAATDVTANKEAAEQIARLAAIVESSGDAMLTLSLDGRVLTWNGGAEQLFGWPAADAVKMPFDQLLNPNNPASAQTALALIASGGSLDRVEVDAVRKDGEPIAVSLSLFGVRNEAGALVSLAGVGRDITEQRRLRDQLQRRLADLQVLNRLRVRLSTAESEREIMAAGLDALLEVCRSPRGTARLSADSEFMHLITARGFSPEYSESQGRVAVPVDPSVDSPIIIEDIETWHGYQGFGAALQKEGVEAFTVIPVRAAGGIVGNITVHFARPYRPTNDELDLAETIAASVSLTLEQHRARLAVEESNERFQAVARATNDAIRDHLLADGSVWWSDAFIVLFGYAREDVQPNIAFWESLIHPEDAQEVIAGVRAAITGGARYWSAEYRFRRADGTYANILDRAYILGAADARATRMIGSMVDVTPLRRAEEDARERERFLSAIIEHSPLAIQIYDAEGLSVRMNEARRKLLGVPSTQAGMGRFNVLKDEYAKMHGLSNRFERAYQGEVVECYDDRLHTDDMRIWPGGPLSERWYDQWIFPVKNEAGEVTAVVSLSSDVTERHQAQEQLRMAQQYLESVVSNAPLLLFTWDADGTLTMAAGAAAGNLASPLGGAGMSIFDVGVPIELRDAVLEALQGVASSRVILFGGRTWDARYTPMRDVNGEITGVIGVSTDITDREIAEASRRLAEERLLSVADSLPVIIFALDRQGRITLATGDGLRALSDTPEKLLSLDAEGASQSPEMQANLRRALAGDAFTAVSPFGGQWLETHFEPVRDEAGEVVGITGVSLDITERRKTEEALLQAQKLESLGILAGGIAHDFNNLLVGILGNAGLALAELAPESPARETIEEIEVAGQRAAELARQMLAYSGKGRFVVQRIDLSALVEEMTHLLRVSITKSAKLDYHFEAGLPSVEVDTTQLRQVVMNLVVNASDAIGELPGRISVTTGVMHADAAYLADTYLAQELPEGDYVFLEVEDTGKGMDAETRARIFDPFFTTKFTGRGLGLAAVLGIVRGHRGAIRVTSEPGVGTTFRLLLPASGPAPSAARLEPSKAPAAQQKGVVLVADDDATVRAVTARALESFGFEVLRAEDGVEAVARFEAENGRVNLVLLDLTMPGLRGDEALERIRAIDPAAKVILMSGYSEQEAMSHFAGHGISAFVQKPYELDALRKAVQSVIEATPADGA